MSDAIKAKVIAEVMEEIIRMMDEVEAQHLATPAGIFGRPTRRHHELMGRHRALTKLNDKLFRKYGNGGNNG